MLRVQLATTPERVARVAELSGYHRPLDGEVANLTLILELSATERADWRLPPLGAPALVLADQTRLLDGILTQVDWTLARIALTIEG